MAATYLFQGLVLGFAAGISPGPMLGLVIGQTLRRGRRAGNLVALAPLFSDLPIILLVVIILGHLPPTALHALSLIGGAFAMYLGIETLRSLRGEIAVTEKAREGRVLLPAVMANFLNPHPYLFWATIGGALLARTFAEGGALLSAAFLICFYALLVGAKLAIALLVNRGRDWLHGRTYQALLGGSGVLLLVIGATLIANGIV
ncbi:MAG TPA: LysE family transporter [Chloroflexota bacterium]|nr:LysE family transporter [Chloroflexota bacterium]